MWHLDTVHETHSLKLTTSYNLAARIQTLAEFFLREGAPLLTHQPSVVGGDSPRTSDDLIASVSDITATTIKHYLQQCFQEEESETTEIFSLVERLHEKAEFVQRVGGEAI